MLAKNHHLAIFMQDYIQTRNAKMGYGIMRYSSNPITCVIDSNFAGKSIRDFGPIDVDVPIVATISEAKAMGAEVFVLGIAPSGGKIPSSWEAPITEALASGLNVVNGLHDSCEPRFGHLIKNSNQWIWDIRVPSFEPRGSAARPMSLSNKRLLTVGTDMAVGKMTSGLEMMRWTKSQGINTSFVATGQIGICITGDGIPLDAFKVDHGSGAVEKKVMEVADSDLIIIEGQGSLLNPDSTATLPLMRGSCPTHLLLCHIAGMETLQDFDYLKIPPLKEVIKLNEDLAKTCGMMADTQCIGVALNTVRLNDEEAEKAVKSLEDEIGLPVTDVLRFGVEKLGSQLLSK